MSLAAIQDNLAKVSLVQQTQTRSDDVARSQEIFQTAIQREQDRQGDQVVLMTHQPEQSLIRPDEEREREERKKKRKKEEEEREAKGEEGAAQAGNAPENDAPPSDGRPRASMRRINIIV